MTFCRIAFLSVCLFPFLACTTVPKPDVTVIPVNRGQDLELPDEATVSGSIESLIIQGTQNSLVQALEKIGAPATSDTEYGRAAAFAVSVLFKVLYPDEPFSPIASDPPETHPMVKAVREAKAGNYVQTTGFARPRVIDVILSVCAVFFSKNPLPDEKILADLDRVEATGVSTIIPELVRALLRENSKDFWGAMEFYRAAILEGGGCAFAETGLGRCLLAIDNKAEARGVYENLVINYPGNLGFRRELGILYYESREWTKAEPLLLQVLQRFPEDSFLVLARANILAELGRWHEVVPLLDAYASVNAGSRLYSLLRIRLEWEGFKTRDKALASCDAALTLFPDDLEFKIFKAEILLGASGRSGEVLEITNEILRADPYNLRALKMEALAAVDRSDFMFDILAIEILSSADRSFSDYKLAYTVYLNAGDQTRVQETADAWYKREPDGEESCLAWLRNMEPKNEPRALEIIRARLSGKGSPRFRSDLFYLRSRYAKSEEAELQDLRQALMEYPQNADALVGMYDINFRRKDYKPAQAYLKQAMVLRPDDAALQIRKTALDEILAARP